MKQQKTSHFVQKVQTNHSKAIKSMEETNLGWFPSEAIQKPIRREWNELEDPWRNGSLLSELVAKLLIDEKSMVKEVEHFDDHGRLLLPPKLLLVGTELAVKSKAQAIHNIQLSLQALQKIHNFPKFEYFAEDLFTEKQYMQKLLRLIQTVFDLRGIGGQPTHISTHRRLLARRLPGRRSSSAPPILEDVMQTKVPSATSIVARAKPNDFYRKITRSHSHNIEEYDSKGRKISPEPNIRRNIPKPTPPLVPPPQLSRINLRSTTNLRNLFNQINENPERRDSSPARRGSDKSLGQSSYMKPFRSRSMSPQISRRSRHIQPQKSFLDEKPAINSSHLSASNISLSSKPASKSNNHHPSKQTKEFSEKVTKLTNIRQLEMMRERLLAQMKDRRIRRRSFLDKYQQSQDLRRRLSGNSSAKEGGGYESPLSSDSLHKYKGRMQDADSQDQKHGEAAGGERRQSNSSFPRSSIVTGTGSVRSSSRSGGGRQQKHDWSPPPLDPIEIDKAKAQTPVLPSITKAQQTAIRDWLLSHGISILDGEGGYYHADDVRQEGNTNLAVTSSVQQLGMLPLPLPKDRLRNGETLCLLFCYLEPTAAFHAHLFQLIQRSPHTIAKAMSNLEKVLWLFRVRRSPPLSMIYLCQPEEIIKCNRDVLWGLLWEIMQCYANSAAGGQTLTSYNSTASFGNLFPQPVNTHYYRPPTTVSQPIGTSNVLSGFSNTSEASRRLSAATTLSSNSAAMNSAKTYHYELPYSPIQRRSLDLSLLEWLESVSILSSILGNIARPPTILALETYIKDGTLFCLLLEKVFTLPLPSGYHRHPHSYSQCLANIGKCVKVLQSCKGMCSRYLYSGVEEDIARGQWDCVLGLLEDLHLFHDTIQQYLVFPSRRNSLPGAMGSDPSKVVIPLIPPIVSSWQQIDRPYLNLGSIQRGRNVSAADSSSSAANSLRQTGAPSANQMISSSATTMNMQNPNHPFTRPAVIVTDDKREEEKKKQQKEYSLLRNLVRLEKYSQPPPSPSTEPLIPPPDTRPQPPLPTNFQPSLDLRQSIPLKRGETEDAAEEEEVEDENDVSFLFSPSQEEKRRDRILTGDTEEEEDDPPDLIPKSVDEFQNSLLQKKAQKYPSVTDMTAGDPAMNFLDLPSASSGNPTQTQSLPARDPIARIPTELQQNHTEQTNSTIKSPSPSSPRKAVARTSIENPSILNTLKIIIDWLSELGIFLPLPQHQFKTYTGNPINDYSIENIAINASLLTDFGKYFSNGLLFARLVMKITHLEITGIEKNPKTQAQRLNNIRKSLEMLAMNNKKIPLRLLSCEEEILRGDSVTILQLMEAMKKAYFFVKT